MEHLLCIWTSVRTSEGAETLGNEKQWARQGSCQGQCPLSGAPLLWSWISLPEETPLLTTHRFKLVPFLPDLPPCRVPCHTNQQSRLWSPLCHFEFTTPTNFCFLLSSSVYLARSQGPLVPESGGLFMLSFIPQIFIDALLCAKHHSSHLGPIREKNLKTTALSVQSTCQLPVGWSS